MRNIVCIAVGCLCSLSVVGQKHDPVRMNRDLKIAEDIITTLFKNESEGGHFHSVKPKATYVAGFGIMINITSNSHFYSESVGKNFSFQWEDGSEPFVIDIDALEDIEEQAEALAREAEELAKMKQKKGEVDDARMKEFEKQSMALEKKAHEIEKQALKMAGVEDCCDDEGEARVHKVIAHQRAMSNDVKQVYIRVMKTFLTDYADLIAQLESDEKIVVTTEFASELNEDPSASGMIRKMSAVATVKNLNAYKQGKMDLEEYQDSIVFSEEAGSPKSPDLELVSSIFKRLYKVDLATTYYCSSSIPYEKVEHFGVIYKMKVYSSTSHGKNNHKINATGQYGLSLEERNEIVDGMYPVFVDDLMVNILDYCRTIKSLKDDENIVFQVRLTECKGCSMPKQVDLSVPCTTLKAYNTGKMSKEDAIGTFTTQESR